MKKKKTWIKFIGLGATVLSAGLVLVSNWVDEQKMNRKIEEEVSKAIADKNKEEES